MANLRVRIEFPDGEKYWLFIDLSKIETIQDVIDDIDSKYSVVCEKLLLDDAQLYCKESVGILQDRDLIRVNLRTSKKRKKETEHSQKVNSLEPVEVESSMVEEVKLLSSLSKPKKKKKCKEDKFVEHESFRNVTFTVIPVSEAPVMEEQKKMKNVETETTTVEKQSWLKEPEPESEIETTIIENTTELNTTDKEPSAEGGAKPKRRRKRKSHHKAGAVDSSLTQTFEAPQYYLPPAPKERQHLRFNEDSGDETEPKTGRSDTVTIEFDKQGKNEPNRHDRTNGPSQEDAKMDLRNSAKAGVYQSPSATSSPIAPQLGALLSLRSAVFSRNSHEKSGSPSYNNVPPPQSLTSKEAIPSFPRASAPLPVKGPPKLDPTKFPVIKGLPRVNDLIAFKVLELSENYNPEISDYMQGRITCMSADSDITVQLLDPKPKRSTRGKFELIEREEEEFEEEPEIEYESTVTYQWNQMIEPRLIFP